MLPATIENVEYLLMGYGISSRYNVIRKKLSITSSAWTSSPDNADEVAMINVVSLANLNCIPRNDVERLVLAVGEKNLYNPVEEWITSKPWDGIDRLPDIYATLTEAEGYPAELKKTLMRKWLLSGVAAAMMPKGFRCRGVLTLQGPQRIGKTTWVSSLVPDETLRFAVIKIDHQLDAGNKDSILGACSHWICEIGELESSMKREVARLKGVLTRDSDKVRKPYGHTESEMPRRTIFIATVNQANFLVDDTGNSRWWVIPVTAVDCEHGIQMQQLFAQLAMDLEAGAEWWLTSEEEAQLAEQHRPHRTISAIEDQLLEVFDLDRIGQSDLPAMTARELLVFLGISIPVNPQCKECAGILRTYLGDPKRINGRDKWRIPLERKEHDRWKSAHRPRGADKYD